MNACPLKHAIGWECLVIRENNCQEDADEQLHSKLGHDCTQPPQVVAAQQGILQMAGESSDILSVAMQMTRTITRLRARSPQSIRLQLQQLRTAFIQLFWQV